VAITLRELSPSTAALKSYIAASAGRALRGIRKINRRAMTKGLVTTAFKLGKTQVI